jgi:hypothetical protein
LDWVDVLDGPLFVNGFIRLGGVFLRVLFGVVGRETNNSYAFSGSQSVNANIEIISLSFFFTDFSSNNS